MLLSHTENLEGRKQAFQSLYHSAVWVTWEALCEVMTGHTDKGAYLFNICESANLCCIVLWECFPCVRTTFVLHLVHYHNNSSPFAAYAFENKLLCLENSRKNTIK